MPKYRVVWICLALFLLTAAVYFPVSAFDFVNFDDPEYVTNNPHVRGGLTPASIAWAFTSGEAANWFPLTWLSHMLDCQFYGVQSGGPHHLTNVALHALATVLLFLFLRRATGAEWRSAFVALLFAWHPLHVESVAWIAERKDVLCAVFWFLTLLAYAGYASAQQPQQQMRRYLLTLLAFALGLLSKPMIVTLPFLLLLLDIWPLRRRGTVPTGRLWREKLPFIGLSIIASGITYAVQHAGGAVQSTQEFPLSLRIENALVSYLVYLGKAVWPAGPAVYYPYPKGFSAGELALAVIVLAGVSTLVFVRRQSAPYLLTGWLWFLGTLVPVIGLVQVGGQARADRYMYVPFAGLGIMLAWGVADLIRQQPRLLAAAGATACLLCAAVTHAQLETWQNSETLFTHALAVTPDNALAEHNLGSYLLGISGRLPDAVAHLEAALRLNPNSVNIRSDLASGLAHTPGRLPDAVAQYRAAIQLEPNAAIPHNNLGNALSELPGHAAEAIAEYQTALRLNPNYPEAHNNLGSVLADEGQTDEARRQFQTALQLRPDYEAARTNLAQLDAPPEPDTAADTHVAAGVALSHQQRLSEAAAEFQAALAIDPNNSEAHNNLGATLAQMPGHAAEAAKHFKAAVRLDPANANAHYNLGVALSEVPGQLPEAIRQLEIAQRLHPDPELAAALAKLKAAAK